MGVTGVGWVGWKLVRQLASSNRDASVGDDDGDGDDD